MDAARPMDTRDRCPPVFGKRRARVFDRARHGGLLEAGVRDLRARTVAGSRRRNPRQPIGPTHGGLGPGALIKSQLLPQRQVLESETRDVG